MHVEKQTQPAPPPAAVLDNKLYVDNDDMKENLFDIDVGSSSTAEKLTGKKTRLFISL